MFRFATITMPAISSSAPARACQPRCRYSSNAVTKRITPMAISQMPISSATAVTPPTGWRMRSTPMTAVSTPRSATSPRLVVLRINEATSSRIPSRSRKIPAMTASVARLLPGSNRMITPATMLSTPTRTTSHQHHVMSRSCACSGCRSWLARRAVNRHRRRGASAGTFPASLRGADARESAAVGADAQPFELRLELVDLGADLFLGLGLTLLAQALAGLLCGGALGVLGDRDLRLDVVERPAQHRAP